MNDNPDDALEALIAKVIEEYPESQWLQQIKKAMPDTDDGAIMSTIEILCGGDLKPIA